jgi:hypothetical protein
MLAQVKMRLRIKPVKLNQSTYVRVPNDISDLVEIEPKTDVTLHFKEHDDLFRLIYSVEKSHNGDRLESVSPIQRALSSC